ncbi:MAG: ATP-binding protein [Pelobium sp.]
MAGGGATWQEDSLIPIYRNGRMEDVYWTFSYSRVIDIDGKIGGVIVTCVETTDKVIAQQEVSDTLNELAASEARLANLITEAPLAIGVLKTRTLIVETANKNILDYWGKTQAVIGFPLAEALPELEGQPFLQILDDVYTSGIAFESSETPAYLVRDGVLSEYFFDILYQPIKDKQGKTDSIFVVATNLTEQVKSRLAIEQSAQQFRQLADSIIQMVWIADANGMHEYYNKRWYDFTGSDLTTTKGEGWNDMFHPDDRERSMEKWNHSLKTGESYEIEYRLKNRYGEYVWVLGRAAAFHDADGSISKWFGTCTDINEQKLLLEQQEDFISIASHELKSPLTSLKGFMQLINRVKGDSIPSSLSGLIDKATKSADKIYGLVDNLLDVSKLNHGGITLNKKGFVVSEMVTDSCEYLISNSLFSLKFTGVSDLEIYADEERIRQVVVNFVSNAIKYASESTEIEIKTELISKYVKIYVIDNGAGIAYDKTLHLFDRYYRGESSESKKPGLGLGLYICSEIIKQHGGEIGVESELGKGTSFWFTLPMLDSNKSEFQ